MTQKFIAKAEVSINAPAATNTNLETIKPLLPNLVYFILSFLNYI